MTTLPVQVQQGLSSAVLVAAEHADRVDREGCFPSEALAALRKAGLMGLLAPARLGGGDGGYAALAEAAGALGGACLSTAICWGMHSQQVATLAEAGGSVCEELLREVVKEGALVASVTSEPGNRGNLFNAAQALTRDGTIVVVEREAPIVSYAAHADLFLATMRVDAEAPTDAVCLVAVRARDAKVEARGSWQAMGMRGTCSVPIRLSGRVPASWVLSSDFRDLAAKAFIPAGHVAWSAAWLGAAREALVRSLRWLRQQAAQERRRVFSDHVFAKVADLRMHLELCEALLDRVVRQLEVLRGTSAAQHRQPHVRIALNNLKIASSEMAFKIVHDLVELAGVAEGFRTDGKLGLNRIFRDLRSASLMFPNERLRQANGRLVIFDGARR